MRGSLGLVALLGLLGGSALGSPITVVRGPVDWSPLAPQDVLFVEGDLAIVRDAGADAAAFTDLYVVNMSNRLAADSLQTFGEVLYTEPAHFAVMRVSPEQIEELAGKLHHEGLACGVVTKLEPEYTIGAAAAAPTPLLPLASADARVLQLTAAVSASNIRELINELAVLPTRFQSTVSGGGVAALLAKHYEVLAAGRADVTITPYDHGRKTGQDSLIVRIQGTRYPDEILVLGSHLDSVNWHDGNRERAPGADDNASGTATNLEIFRLLMAQGVRPLRTLEIHAYAAEEVGLVGSQDIANAYRNRGAKVLGMMQFDMDLYRAVGEELTVWLVSNNASHPLNLMLGQLVDHYVGLPWHERSLSGGSSDHASWYRAGFATAFPFENPSNYNHHIHSADDTVANSGDFALATAYTKLGIAYVSHFAGIN